MQLTAETPPIEVQLTTLNPGLLTLQNTRQHSIPRTSPPPFDKDLGYGEDGNSGELEEADPGCLDDIRPEDDDGSAFELGLEAVFDTTQLDDLRVAVDFVRALQSASLDDNYNNMDSDWLHRLRHPQTQTFNMDTNPDLRLSLDTFFVSMKSSVDTYVAMREAIL